MPRNTTSSSNRAYKRICLLSDGTWKSSESDVPSNILHITEAIAQEDGDGVQQVVFYDAGVGEDESGLHRLASGLLGHGLAENILQLYTQLAINYDAGDEVYLFGFSRGAYTVRSVAGMLHAVGLLRRSQLHLARDAFAAYRSNDPVAQERFQRKTRSLTGVAICALVCFDTVGALGVPKKIAGFDTPQAWRKKYQFHDTTIGPDVRFALHILSIDEERAAYTPTRMRAHPNPTVTMSTDLSTTSDYSSSSPRKRSSRTSMQYQREQQVNAKFFWGVHSGVGGGKRSQQVCADITLRFVVDEMQRRGCALQFDERMLPKGYPRDPSSSSRALTRRHTDHGDTPRRRRSLTDAKNDNAGGGLSTRNRIMRLVAGTYSRKVNSLRQVHWTAVRHYQTDPMYRPTALEHLHKEVLAANWRAMRDEELDGPSGVGRSESNERGSGKREKKNDGKDERRRKSEHFKNNRRKITANGSESTNNY